MKLNFATALLPLAASAAVVPRASSGPLAPRAATWEEYDGETGVLKEDGLCRAYQTNDAPARAVGGADMCNDFCQPARELSSDQDVFSVSCFGDTSKGTPEWTDPEGAMYHMGICKCNHPVVNFVGETFAESLPAIGHVTCAVWKKAIFEAGKLIAATPSPLTPSTASQTLWKVAKTVGKLANGQSSWEEWVARVSGDEPCDFSPAQIFEDFTGISDFDIQAIM